MNVVVVVARGLRADLLGCYGNLWVDTPNFDALAADGVVFDWHFADGAAAWRSWLTGRYPFPGGDAIPQSSTLLDGLKAKGVVTCLVRDGRHAAGEPPGWDRVVTVETAEGQDALEQMLAAAEKSLKKLARRDGWLLWIELATTLPPWDVPRDFQEPYFQTEEEEAEDAEEEDEEAAEEECQEEEDEVEDAVAEETAAPLEPLPAPPLGAVDTGDDALYDRMQSSYAAAVSYLDAGIGLLREKAGGDTLFLVTADAGFPLGEHAIVGAAGAPPHDELIHVPLLVCLPGETEAGRRVAGLTQAVDLAPTLAEAFGLHAPEAHGHSLWPLLRGEAARVRAYAVAGDTAFCLRTPDWALQLPPPETGGKPQLFVKPQDRSEVNDVAQHYLEWAEYLERLLHEFLGAARRPGALAAPALRTIEEVSEEPASSRGEGVPSPAE